LTYQQDKS
jgi:hypothetical protein